jgi:hypothetical protein
LVALCLPAPSTAAMLFRATSHIADVKRFTGFTHR